MHGNFWQWGVASPVGLYPWSGDTSCILGPLANYRWLDKYHLLPFGANSSQEHIAGIGPFRSTETCDIWTYSWARLLFYRNTGDREFGDGVERAFFNAAPGAVTRGFDSLVYFQQPNRLPRQTIGMTSSFGFDYQKVQFVLCCNGMVNNIIPGYVANMWMATYDNGLAATLYGPCTVRALAGDSVPVDLACATGDPFEESVDITVTPQRTVSFPWYVRIPAWCSNASISVNGQAQSAAPDSRGFACVDRSWNAGDRVTLVFPMRVRFLKGTCTPPVAPMPYECVYLGPLLFTLPIAELNGNPNAADDSKTAWRCALDNDGQRPGEDMAVERSTLTSPWVWPFDAPVRIKTPVVRFDWNPKYASNVYGDGNNPDNQSLPAGLVTSGTPDAVYLTPYGCSKFHVSMFPATQRSWEKALPMAVKQDMHQPAARGLDARVVRSGNTYVLTYTVPATETNASVELFGLQGRRLYELGGRTMRPGTHTVMIRAGDRKSDQLASGVCLLRIRSGQYRMDLLLPGL